MGFIQELDIAMRNHPFIKWVIYLFSLTLLIGIIVFVYRFNKAAAEGRGIDISKGAISPEIKSSIDSSKFVGGKNTKVGKESKFKYPQTESKPSKFDLKGASFNAPVQVGDNNVQNNINIDPELSEQEIQLAVDSISTLIRLNNISDKEILIVPIPGSNSSKIVHQLKKALYKGGYIPNVTLLSGYIKLSKGFTYKIENNSYNNGKQIEVYLNTF